MHHIEMPRASTLPLFHRALTRSLRSTGACFVTGALFVIALAATGCNPNSIGRICINPQGSAPLGSQVISPALECPSRLCLIQPANSASTGGAERKTCTAQCESNDDCDPETTEHCKVGFVCAVPTQVGNFCCKRLCVCKDDLVEGFNVKNQGTETEEIIKPHACDRTAPGAIVTCKNVDPL